MEKAYETEPYTEALCVRIISKKITGKTGWFEPDVLLFHPKGGGQPMDKGVVLIGDMQAPLKGLQRERGALFVLVDLRDDKARALFEQLEVGDDVTCRLDFDYRFRAMRFHTATHLVMAAAKSRAADYLSRGIDITDDLQSAVVRFMTSGELSVAEVEQQVNGFIKGETAVTTHYYSSIDEARGERAQLFRGDPQLSIQGNVRMVLIDGIDFNPCGGTHVRRLSEIGGLRLELVGKDDQGEHELNVFLADA